MNTSGRFRRLVQLLAVLSVFVLIAAACGDDDDDAGSGSDGQDQAVDSADDGGENPDDAGEEPADDGGADDAGEEPADDGGADDAGEEPADDGAAAGEIDLDASIVYATTNPLQTLDPHGGASPSTGTFPYLEPIYDRLIGLGPDMTLEPMLATEWGFSDDGLTFTLSLRDDAVFSDGDPLSAEAVKLSIERLQNPDAGFRETSEIASVDSVEVIDDLTVAFNLNRPDAALPYTLASAVGIVVSPNAIGSEDLGENPVGIGPYVVTEYVAGDRTTYERNPNYYNPDVQNFATMEVRFIVDDNARINGLRSGELDIVYISPGQTIEMQELADAEDFGLHRAPAFGYEYIWLNLDTIPEREIREAIMLALDREAIAEALFGNDCAVTSQPQGPGMIGHDPALEDLYPHDPERAAEIIAGLPEAPSYTWAALASSPNREMATVIEQQLEEVGFEIEVTQGDSAAQFGAFAQGQVDGIPGISASAPYFQGQVLTPIFMALAKAADHASPEILGLAAQVGDATISEDERNQIIADINRLYTEELLGMLVCRTGIKAGYGSDIVGVDDMRFPISRRAHDLRHLAKLAE